MDRYVPVQRWEGLPPALGRGARVKAMKQAKLSEIKVFIHCKECARGLPDEMSPRQYARLEVGFTVPGIQIWCVRHEKEVVHFDFQGHKVKQI